MQNSILYFDTGHMFKGAERLTFLCETAQGSAGPSEKVTAAVPWRIPNVFASFEKQKGFHRFPKFPDVFQYTLKKGRTVFSANF